MKSKLKVRRIVDSFLSKDDVGFYKIEWEESWIPVDACQHLKNLIELFWSEKKVNEEIVAQQKKEIEEKKKEIEEKKKEIEEKKKEDEEKKKEIEKKKKEDEEKKKEIEEKKEDEEKTTAETTWEEQLETESSSESSSFPGDTSEEQVENISIETKAEGETSSVGKTEIFVPKPVIQITNSCFFCGQYILTRDLNKHEREHIRENRSDVLIRLIGVEPQNENAVVVHFGGEASSSNKVAPDTIPPNSRPDTLNPVSKNDNNNISNSENNNSNNNNNNNNNNNIPVGNSDSSEVSPTLTIHHRSDNSTGLSCPVCNKTFTLFNDFHLHFQTHRSNPRYYFCEECGKQYLSKELFEKHTQLHIESNRRLKTYGSKISSVKPNRKNIRRIIYPRLYQSSAIKDAYDDKDQLIDLSESPFGSMPGERDLRSGESYSGTKMFVEMLETNRYRKRARKEATEFSPDVLRSARQYIKAVSKRRKIIKRSRLQAQEKEREQNPTVNTLVDGIGVDVELERSEDSLPNISFINGKKAYSCKICSKTFFNKFHHREHYNVHSGEMPYECEFCLKRFAQRSGWNRHIKLHHKYDVFAGPLPRFALEKQDEKFAASPPAGTPIIIKHLGPMVMQANIQKAHSENVVTTGPLILPVTCKTSTSVSASRSGSPTSPISELTRLAFETAPPSVALPPQPPLHVLPQPAHAPQAQTHGSSQPAAHVLSQSTAFTPSQPLAQTSSKPPAQPAGYQLRYDQLPDAVKQAMQPGITPPSFNETSAIQHASVSQTASKKNHVTGEKTTAFQCKKVRTMNGDLIFMIRVSAKANSVAPNKEFAYILDDAGFVESRIFVDDYPGGDWLDFPLDETANDVLRSRVHDYDEQNRRGPKPAHLAANRKQLSKNEEKDIVAEVGKNQPKLPRLPISTKDIIASSLVFTTTSAGEPVTPTVTKSTHGRSFRSGREKRFSCHICERKFLAQAHLNDHMLIHTGELPYKCMFCNRPFRHKSGLNSHHKRHIQRGVFNRPISSKDKVIYTADKQPPNMAEVIKAGSAQAMKDLSSAMKDQDGIPQQLNQLTSLVTTVGSPFDASATSQAFSGTQATQSSSTYTSTPITEKPKRKGRKPKQVRKSPVEMIFNGEETDTKPEILLKLVPDTEEKNDSTTNDDVFKCNFCSLTFPMRTAYLKHVHRMHKASNAGDDFDRMDETDSIGEFDPDDNLFSEFNEISVKQEVFDESPIEMEDDLNNGGVENLFPDVTIKEEEVDDSYPL